MALCTHAHRGTIKTTHGRSGAQQSHAHGKRERVRSILCRRARAHEHAPELLITGHPRTCMRAEVSLSRTQTHTRPQMCPKMHASVHAHRVACQAACTTSASWASSLRTLVRCLSCTSVSCLSQRLAQFLYFRPFARTEQHQQYIWEIIRYFTPISGAHSPCHPAGPSQQDKERLAMNMDCENRTA
eukprot:6200442-Pleurochrysis_carterae.AAC.2